MSTSTHDIYHNDTHFIMELQIEDGERTGYITLTEACEATQDPRPCEWFINKATEPAWCCDTHQYDGTGDYPTKYDEKTGGKHPEQCPSAEDDTECSDNHETHDFKEIEA